MRTSLPLQVFLSSLPHNVPPLIFTDPEGPSLPVLFVPGNAGMYQQANALAAETARQWDRATRQGIGAQSRHHANLDWYSIDTKEQWSAFHGDVLVSSVFAYVGGV